MANEFFNKEKNIRAVNQSMAKRFLCAPDAPVVTTALGKLRGYCYDGVYTFRGVPYARAQRFQMPQKAEPWKGLRNALNYGFVSPLVERPQPENNLLLEKRFWPEDEHCQNLNIWSPSLDALAKLPVMVWLHGGGFQTGSSIEMTAYDGAALSAFGEVVVVTLNHRLNILGYLDLSSFGARYENSGNAGMADVVEGLRWVRENIAHFGGDPDNVTIFGQSGGGGKAIALGQIPAAEGLFQKVILMSVVVDLYFGRRDDRAVVLDMLDRLGLTKKDARLLETIPYSDLARAYRQTRKELAPQGIQFFSAPIENGWYRGDPLQKGFSAWMDRIPVLLGTTISEVEPGGVGLFAARNIGETEKTGLVFQRYGEKTDELLRLFRQAYPEKDILQLLALDVLFRGPALSYLELRKCTQAETYSYIFSLEFDHLGGTPAWHSGDIPFAFHNASRVPVCSLGEASERLEEQYCSAFVQFAKSSAPRHALLPDWPSYREEHRATMLFDRRCDVRLDFDRELIQRLKTAFIPFRSDAVYRDE